MKEYSVFIKIEQKLNEKLCYYSICTDILNFKVCITFVVDADKQKKPTAIKNSGKMIENGSGN